MYILIEMLFTILQNPILLFCVECISCVLKLYILIFLVFKAIRVPKVPRPFTFLVGVLVGGLVVDLSWFVKLVRLIFLPQLDYRFIIFFIRIAWAFNLVQLQSLGLFIESLGEQNYKIKAHQFFLLMMNCFCITYFIGISFLNFNFISPEDRSWFEFKMMEMTSTAMLLILLIPSVYFTIKKLRASDFPKILKKQLTVLAKYLIGSFIVSELIQGICVASTLHIYAATTLSTSVLAFAIYYTTRTIMGLRFLNLQNHVQSKHKFNFIDDFKNLLEKLSRVTNMQELGHITQMFFKEAFDIMPSRIFLYFRKLNTQVAEDDLQELSRTEASVENFINRHNERYGKLRHIFAQQKIFIYDEISFSNFYEESQINQEILLFLDDINADVFLPIHDHQSLIAYIIIERNARSNRFYSNIERDEMLVFASYLGNIINLLQNRNLTRLIQKEKEMRDELYQKHHEITQYQESIRSFMRDNKQRKIGILFYKNGKFEFGNKDAKDLIDVNLNTFLGHPITKALKQLVTQVKEYKLSQTLLLKDAQGNKLVLSAIPNLEHNNIIITVHYPEISDIIKQQLEYLKDPSEWDYLLYLETTKSGQLINQLIPGLGEQLLNFKIELLKMALTKKPLLLDLPEDDLLPTVDILHHISLRERLHVVKLQRPITDAQIAISLFGINPIFGDVNNTQPLLEQLNNIGTLFIQNIHFLDLDSQNYLAEYIKYGFYHVYKSDRRVVSNVRVICSTNQHLQQLVQEGKFSRVLFDELKQVVVRMPSLLTLPTEEVDALVQGFSEQAVASPLFQNLLELSVRDKQKLAHTRPVSLQEFREKVHQLLVQKSKKVNIYQETTFDPAYNIADPELSEAARLGKKALRDQKIMTMLWNKFKNQNKIARFLGTDRSSVSRRCKDYNLT